MTRQLLRGVSIGVLAVMALAAATTAFAGTIERVNARQTDVWQARVYAGVPVTVTVDGNGATDLDLYIYDEDGILVAVDDDFTDYCIGSWTPWFTGTVTIRIVNRGNVSNRYEITVRGGYLY